MLYIQRGLCDSRKIAKGLRGFFKRLRGVSKRITYLNNLERTPNPCFTEVLSEKLTDEPRDIEERLLGSSC